MKKHIQPNLIPPSDFSPEAITEWNRLLSEAEQTGRQLKPADRSLLILYCQTWTINQKMHAHIKQHGAVVKWPNGVVGQSPQYKTFEATTKQLRGLLSDLGCSPLSRDFDAVEPVKDESLAELSF